MEAKTGADVAVTTGAGHSGAECGDDRYQEMGSQAGQVGNGCIARPRACSAPA